MQFRVIPNLVAARDGFFNEFRTLTYISANQEKCRLRFVTIEKIEQLWRDRRIWPVVESKSQFARGVRAANRRSEELRSRIDPTISGEPCSSDSNRCGRFDEPGIHAALILPESQGSAPCKSSFDRSHRKSRHRLYQFGSNSVMCSYKAHCFYLPN